MNICVTNLSRETTEDALRYTFSAFGQVRQVNITGDAATGGVKALVSMPIEQEARTAIGAINGTNLGGRIVQAVGQAGSNILRVRDTPIVSRGIHAKPGRDSRGRSGRNGHRRPARDSRGRPHRGKRRR